MARRLRRIMVLSFAALLAACAGQRQPPAQAALERPVFTQTGVASWYGPDHQGKTTANGEAFDMGALTAAHRNLPFGTIVRVTNTTTKRTIKVRINDRGPFVPGRIIDLSARAARDLGITENGVGRVRVEQFSSDQAGGR